MHIFMNTNIQFSHKTVYIITYSDLRESKRTAKHKHSFLPRVLLSPRVFFGRPQSDHNEGQDACRVMKGGRGREGEEGPAVFTCTRKKNINIISENGAGISFL